MSLGQRVREARLKAQLTQEDLARKGNVRVRTIIRWERGTTTSPHSAELSRVAQALNVTTDWLLTGSVQAA